MLKQTIEEHQSVMQHFVRRAVMFFKSYIHDVKTNPKVILAPRYRFVTGGLLILVLLLVFSFSVYAHNAANKNSQDNNMQKTTTNPTPSDTPTPTDIPVPSKTQSNVLSTPTLTTAPTKSLFGAVKMRALDDKTEGLLDNNTTFKLYNEDRSFDKYVVDAKEVSFSDLKPGKYFASIGYPPNYRGTLSNCINGQCYSIGINDCGVKFDLSAGQELTFYCKFEKDTSFTVAHPTSVPTPTPQGKPEFAVEYPKNGETVTLTSADQRFCFITSTGKNNNGLTISYNLNNTGWTTNPCVAPPEGSNAVQVKAVNSDHIESDIITLTFIFHKNY